MGINTSGFEEPLIDVPGAFAGRLSVGGFPVGGSEGATTGFGRLDIANGGQLTNGAGSSIDTFIGIGNGSDGGVTVSGAGSNWTTTDFVFVGASGSTGSLQVADESTADFGALFVGVSLEDGLGLTFGNDSGPSVGSLEVTGGAQLTADFFADVGVGRDATGEISVSGPGSTLSSDGGVLVGVLGGTGTFNVVDGGTFATGPDGPFRSSVIGGGGPSNMGMGPPINGGVGEALISGAGSTWTNGGGLYIGGFVDTEAGAVYPGIGTLTIEDGGQLTSTGGDSGLPDVVGLGAGSFGTAVVTGRGSQWTAAQNLAVGFGGGTGAATIDEEGAVNTIGIFGVGIGITGQPGGDGTLNVLSGGTLTSNSGLADDVTGGLVGAGDATGVVTISGAGSSWVVDGRVFLGGQPELDLSPGTGAVRIESDGNLTASVGITLAAEAGSFGTLTIGAEPGRPATAPGTLDAPDITFGNGTGILNFNLSAAPYVFDTAISGPGAINHIDGTTVLTGDSTAFTGSLNVYGGEVQVDGTLGPTSLVGVSPAGRFGGSGTIGGLTVGGTLAPGNSIGTMTAAGDLTFGSSSRFEVEIAGDGQSDKVVVGGTATLGGTVDVIALDPQTSYKDGQSYRILDAGSVSGTFADVTTRSAFITPSLQYDANGVDLAIGVGGVFITAAGSFNETQAATALDDLDQSGDALAVYNRVLMLSETEAKLAFNLVSGEIHASAQEMVNQSFGVFSQALRLRAQPKSTASVEVTRSVSDWALGDAGASSAWVAPLAAHGTLDGDGNASDFDWMTAGLVGGFERRLAVPQGEAIAGIALGHQQGQGDIDATMWSVDTETLGIGLYGAWFNGPWSLSGAVGYASSDVSSERRIAFGGLDRTAEANYRSETLGLSGEVAYGFDLQSGMTVSPLATIDASWSRHGDADESGAGALDLQIDEEEWHQLDGGVGVAVAQTFDTGNGRLTAEGRAVLEHAFADETYSQALKLAGSPTEFAVDAPDAARDRLRLGLGVSYEVTDNAYLKAGYEGVFSSDERSHGGFVGINRKF